MVIVGSRRGKTDTVGWMITFQTSRSLPHTNIALSAQLGFPSEFTFATLYISLFIVVQQMSYRPLTMSLWITQDQDHRMGITELQNC